MLTALSGLGSNKDHTARAARTIYSCGRCILKDCNLLDALGGYCLKASLNTVNQNQRGIASHEGCHTAKHDG